MPGVTICTVNLQPLQQNGKEWERSCGRGMAPGGFRQRLTEMCWLVRLHMDFFFTTLVLCESHLPPESYLVNLSAQDETLHYVVVCWNLRSCQVYSKRSQPWVEFQTRGKSWNCSAFKIHCKCISSVLAVEPGLPQGLSCNAASRDFSRSSFQNLCHNCICKEVVLGINSWLADGFTQWSLYQASSTHRQSRSMLHLAQGSEIECIERILQSYACFRALLPLTWGWSSHFPNRFPLLWCCMNSPQQQHKRVTCQGRQQNWRWAKSCWLHRIKKAEKDTRHIFPSHLFHQDES